MQRLLAIGVIGLGGLTVVACGGATSSAPTTTPTTAAQIGAQGFLSSFNHHPEFTNIDVGVLITEAGTICTDMRDGLTVAGEVQLVQAQIEVQTNYAQSLTPNDASFLVATSVHYMCPQEAAPPPTEPPGTVNVPDVGSGTVPEATATLKADGFAVQVVQATPESYGACSPPGQPVKPGFDPSGSIVMTEPSATSSVAPGSTVTIEVCP